MRLAMGVEYSGSNFHGWQRQKNATRTVQAVVEKSLSQVADHPVKIFCAGRTDAGVHAAGQVIHFDTKAQRDDKAWLFGGNRFLPEDVNFLWVRNVAADFHAQFDALGREYQYRIFNRKTRSALQAPKTAWQPRKLDERNMRKAAQYLVGTHDFSSFRSSVCQAKTAVKTVEFIRVRRSGDEIIIDIKANGFLHHMVRNIVGTLLKIGRNEAAAEWMEFVLKSRDRKIAGETARPEGLCFMKAYYRDF